MVGNKPIDWRLPRDETKIMITFRIVPFRGWQVLLVLLGMNAGGGLLGQRR